MKFMIVSDLAANSDHERKKLLELYAKFGAPSGTEGLWVTADGQHVVQLMELDDLTEFSETSNRFLTAFAGANTTWYPLVDAEVSIEHQLAGIEARAAVD